MRGMFSFLTCVLGKSVDRSTETSSYLLGAKPFEKGMYVTLCVLNKVFTGNIVSLEGRTTPLYSLRVQFSASSILLAIAYKILLRHSLAFSYPLVSMHLDIN